MSEAIGRLLHRLDLEPGEAGDGFATWKGTAGQHALNMGNRLFGGFVFAQTIVAAGRTDPERDVHSVQQVFLRAGNASDPLEYRVEQLFSGRTFASVRVEVHQGGQIISHSQVGLTLRSETMRAASPDRQKPAPVLASRDTMANRDVLRNRPNPHDQPVEMLIDPEQENDGQPFVATWTRPSGPLPDDHLMHQAVMGFTSDRGLMSIIARPHAKAGAFRGATLDHSIWFHRPVRFDDWHSYVMQSPTLSEGRGLSRGEFHHADGTHVASTQQQGMFRLVD